MSRVLIVGAGDMAERLAHGLAASGRVNTIVLVNASRRVDLVAATLASSHDVTVHSHVVDARSTTALVDLLRRHRPDLVVQAAALMSPWALGGRSDPAAAALADAGLGLRLPLQLPILLALMRATKDAGYDGPVANLSFPDVTHKLLHRIGLAPTIGLGNVAMYLVRARAALRAEVGPEAPMPLVRVVGQHGTVYRVMAADRPTDRGVGPWIWTGDDPGAERRDELAYTGSPIPPTVVFNIVTAAASLPVLLALLPGADPLRWSTPAPFGLFGGYPVRIADGAIALDLPDGVEFADCQAVCARAAAGDGIDRIDDDGTVHFTEAARAAVRDIAPDIAEPFTIDDTDRRAQRIVGLVHG